MAFLYICAKPSSLTKNEGKLFLVPKSSGPLLERLPLNLATFPAINQLTYREEFRS